MKQKYLVFFSIFIYSTLSFSTVIEGFGYGSDEKEAKSASLSDLSSNISVVVKSDYHSFVSAKGDQYNKQVAELIHLKSQLPILGAEFEHDKIQKMIKASLTAQKVLHLYATKLSDLKKEMQTLQQKITQTDKQDQKYSLLELLFATIQSYKKHEIVYLLLGGKKDQDLTISESQIQSQIIDLSQNIDSLELAAKLLSKNFTHKNIYAFAPTTDASHEITPFASLFRNLLQSHISSSATPAKSDYLLNGTYDTTPDGLFLSLHLRDKANNPLKSSSLFIKKSAYKGIRVQPKHLTFDQEVELSANKLKSDLKIDLAMKDFGSENILLSKGQEVELVFKSNKRTFFYIIGHTLHDNKRFSYLIELQEGEGNEKFVYTLGASDVNRPVLLPLSFEVDAPFGYESLQVFASTEYPHKLPHCSYNNDGYCIIGDDPQKVVAKTRALKAKKQKVQQAESSLNFTTVEQ